MTERHRSAPMISLIRVVLVGAAAALALWGLSGMVDADGAGRMHAWWLMTLALAVAMPALGLGGAWAAPALTMASFLAGLAAQLALRDPFWFQHLHLKPDGPVSYLIFAALAGQGVVALAVIWSRDVLPRAWRAVPDLGLLRVCAVLAVLAVFSASAMQQIALGDPGHYLRQLVISVTFIGLNIASFMALVAACPGDGAAALAARLGRIVSLPGMPAPAGARLDRYLPLLLAGAVTLMAALIAIVALEAVPHLDDITYRFQARYLADGLLAWPVPPGREAFDIYLMDQYRDRWFATTFPGWPAALALGQILHIEILLTPLLGGLGVLLLHRVVADVFDRGSAHLAALLLAVSPWYLGSSANPLIHTFTAVLILGAWALLLGARRRPVLAAPFLAGLLMAWLVLTRPLEGLLIGTLTGLALLSLLPGDRRHIRTVIAYGAGCIALGWLIFPYNAYLTGDMLAAPLNVYYDHYWGPNANDLGFGPDRGAVPDWGTVDVFTGHSPLEALINAHQNMTEINSSFLGWGGASLAFVLVYLFWGRWTALTRWLGLICIATFGLYSFYWFYGGYYAGARYWFMTLVPFLIFTLLGIRTAADRATVLFPASRAGPRLGVGIGFLCLASVATFSSWMAVNRYPGINGYHADYRDLAAEPRFDNALVFINNATEKEYGSAYWLNDFDPHARSPLFARNLGPEMVAEIARAYPDRPIFFVDGRTAETPEVLVKRGPLTLADVGDEDF